MASEELNSFTFHTKNLFSHVSYLLVLRRHVIVFYKYALKLQRNLEIK